jgi:hypothetical protein
MMPKYFACKAGPIPLNSRYGDEADERADECCDMRAADPPIYIFFSSLYFSLVLKFPHIFLLVALG